VDVPSAAATGSHFLVHEAPQSFPVNRYTMLKIKKEKAKEIHKKI
jgi:hypothetical protein